MVDLLIERQVRRLSQYKFIVLSVCVCVFSVRVLAVVSVLLHVLRNNAGWVSVAGAAAAATATAAAAHE